MKKLKKFKTGKFFYLLIKNYVLFTIVNVIIIYLMFLIGGIIMSKSLDNLYGTPSDQLDILESGDYDKLNIKKIAGKKGFIEILDENNKVIYRSNELEEKESIYTNKELKYISEYEENPYMISIERYKDKNNKESIIIVREKYKPYEDSSYFDYSSYNENIDGWYEILDESLNVVFSGGDIKEKNTSYTEKELNYLTGNISKNYRIYKYLFKDKSGKERTLLLNLYKLDDEKVEYIMERDMKITIGLFIIIYSICIAIFVIWLNKKVKTPLVKLNNAIISLAKGKSEEIVEYEGPNEFIQICDNFNEMVSKLKKSEYEKEQLELEKQKILADISHDLKTPITIIQGYAKALSDGIISKEDEEKYFKIIYQKSNNLTELINIFYEYNKLEHADFILDLRKNDLSEFLRAYIAEKYEYIYDIEFELDIDIPEKELYYEFDSVQLKRALDNIISNSIKHNKEGTTLFISLQDEKNNYKITVGDNGVGIPKNIVDNIFDAFVVGEESRNTSKGSGLGLAITRKIIEKHKGSIRLICSENKKYKTLFEIELPKKEL